MNMIFLLYIEAALFSLGIIEGVFAKVIILSFYRTVNAQSDFRNQSIHHWWIRKLNRNEASVVKENLVPIVPFDWV